MEIFNSFDIVWEKTLENQIGFYKPVPKKIFNPNMMKNLAIAKMIDIKLISAKFKDDTIIFSPIFWILFDSSDSLEFIGIYTSEDLDNDETMSIQTKEVDTLPSICVRKSLWNKQKDMKKFNSADDKKQYVVGDKQITSNVYFFNSVQVKLIKKIILEFRDIFNSGLKFKKLSSKISNGNFSHYNRIQIKFSECEFNFDLDYNPYLATSDALENWIIRWRKYIDELPLETGYSPDEKFRISFNLSLFDQINCLVNKF